MTNEDIKQHIWRNTASNYFCMALRLIGGLVMFRLLYQELTKEEFGFWALLWSVFGYGILLDFGFGFTAQKRVAELSVHQDWNRLSKVLSTIFFSYVGVAGLIILVGLVGSRPFVAFLNITPGNQDRFHEILILFFCGLGLAFPLGLFPEMLRGQQRICLANTLMAGGMIANFVLVLLAVHFHWGLKMIFLIALCCAFVPDLLCGFFAMRRLPGVRIDPRFFSREMVRETISFSLFAYFAAVSYIIVAKTDQLVISTTLSVMAVAIYQAGAKIAEMFSALGHQLPDTFSPAAAHLHAKGDREGLQRLLVNGTRFSVMLATPLYLVFAFYMDGLLTLLTGEKIPNRETFWVAQVLLCWGYMMVLTQSVSKRIFMMTGHERKLMWLGLGEAALNLTLSVGLVLYFRNVLCVAIGSLVSTVVFGWFYLWPWAAREASLSGWALARTVLLPTWLACLPLLGLVVVEHFVPQLDFRHGFIALAIQGSIALLVAGWGLWKVALTAAERVKVVAALNKMLNRSRLA